MTPEKLVLYEIRDTIAQLPEDDRIMIEAIAMTLRNILKGEQHAHATISFGRCGRGGQAVRRRQRKIVYIRRRSARPRWRERRLDHLRRGIVHSPAILHDLEEVTAAFGPSVDESEAARAFFL
jgi:hypothetical protein